MCYNYSTTKPGNEEVDDQNHIIFIEKTQVSKFLKEYCSNIQNSLFLQSNGQYFVPSILCDSDEEKALMILRNCDSLQNYKILHQKYSKLGENYKLHDFVFVGDDPNLWRDQLLNDLKNLYLSEGLHLIGAFSQNQKSLNTNTSGSPPSTSNQNLI